MGYPSEGSSYPDLKNGTSIAKTYRDKLKLLKSVLATKIDLKDKFRKRNPIFFYP